MGEINLGMVGVILAAIIFSLGVAVGVYVGKSKIKEWLKEHGCYTCNEMYENQD